MRQSQPPSCYEEHSIRAKVAVLQGKQLVGDLRLSLLWVHDLYFISRRHVNESLDSGEQARNWKS